ncbi:MAG: acetylornithine transaminase [Clostridia bacterium]|nr:acetylornithine transaminase [Clostridia bacterium]
MNNTEQLIKEGQQYVMNTYGRLPMALVKGQGSNVWDADGKEYLDFVGGLAVTSLGHCHPKVAAAIAEQANTLIHCSNLYWIEPQIKLAKWLVEHSCMDKVFFANSGAEANEGAIKLARKYAFINSIGNSIGESPKYEIITMTKSFHGRTLATLTATGQEKFHQGYSPLPAGFKYSPFNELEALKEAITPQTCAVMVEPIQGEGGVNVATEDFLKGVRQLCDEKGLLLIFDEVQVGIGRTGTWFAYEHFGVEPDIMTLAKALGSGVPIGALLAKDRVAAAFQPGDHASTFGGNPLVCSAGLATVQAMTEEKALENAVALSQQAFNRLEELKAKYSVIRQVRGKGLMIGIELAEPGQEVVVGCQRRGLLVNCAAGNVIRLLPPLNVSEKELGQALDILEQAIAEMEQQS